MKYYTNIEEEITNLIQSEITDFNARFGDLQAIQGMMQTLRAVLGPVLGPSSILSNEVQETHWKLIEDNFKHMIWSIFGKPDMKDFGDIFVNEVEEKIKEDPIWQK